MTTARNRDEILRKRAERLIAEEAESAPRRVALQVAIVGVGEQRIGIRVEDLREIVPTPEITPLPGLPRWLLGLTQVRGELLGVVDLGAILGGSSQHRPVLAVIEDRRGPFGLACESVIGFRPIYEDEISAELVPEPDRPFRAVTRDLVALLDMGRLPVAPDGLR